MNIEKMKIQSLLLSDSEADNKIAFQLIARDIPSEDNYVEFKEKVLEILGFKSTKYFVRESKDWLAFNFWSRSLHTYTYER